MSNIDNIKDPQLRALADSCQHRSTGDFGLTIVGGVDLEKFAEQIVAKCAGICYSHSRAAGGTDTAIGTGYLECGDDIKRYFKIT